MEKVTSTQPQPVKQRIYGSTPVEPLAGASNQPDVVAGTKSYNSKVLPTTRVTRKGDKDERVLTINASDLDPDQHVAVD